MAKYGVVVHEPYEVHMNEFATLKEARAYVRRKEERVATSPVAVDLVRILSEHMEGSNPKPRVLTVKLPSKTFKKWSQENSNAVKD